MHHLFRATLTFATAAVVAGCAGDGGGSGGSGSTAIPDVRDCLSGALKGAKVESTSPKDKDDKVEAGVFVTTDPSPGASAGGGPAGSFVMAMAADVKSEDSVESFKEDTKRLAEQLVQGGGEKLDVESGTKGNYVWVVAGAKGAGGFDDARDCVKP